MQRGSVIHSWAKANKHVLFLIFIYAFGVFLFSLLIHFTHRLIGSDDTVFPVQIQPYHSVFDWLNYRYHEWSGRIFSESFVYIFSQAPLILWKIASVTLYAVFSGILFAYSKLFSKNDSKSKDYFMLALALLLPFLIDPDVFFSASLWVSGSMNYFWIMTFGLVAFYPVFYYVTRNHRPHRLITIIGLLSAVIAASSQEQIGIVLLVLMLILTIYKLAITMKEKIKHIPIYLFVFTAVICASFLISVLAPGNSVRLKAETITWLPDFYATPLIEHINYGYRWVLDSLLNHTGLLLAGTWGLVAALLIKKSNKDRLDRIFIFVLAGLCLFTLSKGFNGINHWYEFFATWKPQLPSMANLIFLPWTIALLATVAGPIILYRDNKGFFLSLLFCAVIASTIMITLSPTVYASGVRTLYVPSIILLIIFYVLMDSILSKYKNYRFLIIGLIACLAISQFLILALKVTR